LHGNNFLSFTFSAVVGVDTKDIRYPRISNDFGWYSKNRQVIGYIKLSTIHMPGFYIIIV